MGQKIMFLRNDWFCCCTYLCIKPMAHISIHNIRFSHYLYICVGLLVSITLYNIEWFCKLEYAFITMKMKVWTGIFSKLYIFLCLPLNPLEHSSRATNFPRGALWMYAPSHLCSLFKKSVLIASLLIYFPMP